MSRLDSDQRAQAQAKASGPETATEKEWYREDTGSPPTCLDFPDFLHRSACHLRTNTPHMAPNANPVTVTLASPVSAPKSELEDTLYSRSLSIPEPMVGSRDEHEANNLADTKTCFLEDSLLFDYNPILDTSTMYTDVPAEDRGTSNSVLKLPTTNADAGHWLFGMAPPTVVGETASNRMAQDERGMQSNQEVSNWGLSTLSAALRVATSPARDINSPTSDLVNSAALDSLGKGPMIVVQSTLVWPPNAMVAVPAKQKGRPKQKPYRDADILMGRGGNATYHPGNRRYLVAMRKRLVQYHNCERSEKIKISQQVVDEVHAWGGRFLKTVKGSNTYVEVSNKIARSRVSQALRDGKAS
jgi:hypothetical protein